MSGSVGGDLKMTASVRTKLQMQLASAVEYTMVLSTHCQWRQMVCIFDKKNKYSEPNPTLFFLSLSSPTKTQLGRNTTGIYIAQANKNACLRVSLFYFYFLIMTAAFPLKIYANSKFIFGRGGIFSTNLSGETSALHNLRLQTSSVSAHYYWLVSLFIQSHFVSRRFLAFKSDTTMQRSETH